MGWRVFAETSPFWAGFSSVRVMAVGSGRLLRWTLGREVEIELRGRRFEFGRRSGYDAGLPTRGCREWRIYQRERRLQFAVCVCGHVGCRTSLQPRPAALGRAIDRFEGQAQWKIQKDGLRMGRFRISDFRIKSMTDYQHRSSLALRTVRMRPGQPIVRALRKPLIKQTPYCTLSSLR